MARKIRLTRPELKKQRDALVRYERYLPMLKLKQQQLQMKVVETARLRRAAHADADGVRTRMDAYQSVLHDPAGVNFEALSAPSEVRTHRESVAGVVVPVFDSVSFPPAEYTLFGTPPWVDRALGDYRELNRHLARVRVLDEQYRLIRVALTKIIQRVNLFEKVLVPQTTENIRVIRIHLGEEQTAAIGRAKLAKAKLVRMERAAAPEAPAPSGREGSA
jgi:V/A-type H+-transporting ATPase subunit D